MGDPNERDRRLEFGEGDSAAVDYFIEKGWYVELGKREDLVRTEVGGYLRCGDDRLPKTDVPGAVIVRYGKGPAILALFMDSWR